MTIRNSTIVIRTFWTSRIESELRERNVLWLKGVRRVGKTTLVKSLAGAAYFDCELVRVRRQLEDPEYFWRSQEGSLVVLDEIHRLPNPSEVLKIAADYYPNIRVVATGSSTLSAKEKFRDSLTGRKRELWLVPLIAADLEAFGKEDLDHRLLRGGLPPFFLASKMDDKDYEEWINSYWAKDVSELFVVERKSAFMKLVELIFSQSGGLFEAQSFSQVCEVSRPTIQNYLSILETTLLVIVLRPFFGGGANEIRSQPKVYGFDSGFVAYFRGWDHIRDDDRGYLLEHLVLGELVARYDLGRLHYWRDKQQHEIDFVLEVGRRRELVAIECKASADKFDSAGLLAFRRKYPKGRNIVVVLRQTRISKRSFQGVEVSFVPFLQFPAFVSIDAAAAAT